MAARKNHADEKQELDAADRARAAAARAEVIEILAGAIFTLMLKGQVPGLTAGRTEQQGECS